MDNFKPWEERDIDYFYKTDAELSMYQFIKFEFPNIQNLKVENGSITFDEGEYTKREVETRIDEFIKSCQK